MHRTVRADIRAAVGAGAPAAAGGGAALRVRGRRQPGVRRGHRGQRRAGTFTRHVGREAATNRCAGSVGRATA